MDPLSSSTRLRSHVPITVALLLILVAGVPAQVEHADPPSMEAVAPAPFNTMCPVMTDQPVDPQIFVDHQGHLVHFCCPMCRRIFLEDPSPHLASLPQFAPGGAVESAPVTHGHPATGEAQASNSTEGHGHEEGHEQGAAAETAGATTHDHSEDHGQAAGPAALIAFAGKFHPVVVHFPIALLLAAALADALFLITGRESFRGTVAFLLVLAAAGAAVAVPLGWAAAWGASYPDPLARLLWLHRWMGTTAGLLSFIILGLFLLGRRGKAAWAPVAFRVALYAGAALVGVTGHFGAMLVYGPNHFGF